MEILSIWIQFSESRMKGGKWDEKWRLEYEDFGVALADGSPLCDTLKILS